jgi:hypothetical protein
LAQTLIAEAPVAPVAPGMPCGPCWFQVTFFSFFVHRPRALKNSSPVFLFAQAVRVLELVVAAMA